MQQLERISTSETEGQEAMQAIEAGRKELGQLELEMGAIVERMLTVAEGIGEAKRATGLGVVDLGKEHIALVRIKGILIASGMTPERSMQVATALVLTRREVQLSQLSREPVNNAD